MDIREKMKRDWDRRARVDPRYWVAATEEADDASYHQSAENDSQAFLSGLGDRARPDAHVLDLGCGIGRMTAPLASHFERVVGVDVSDEMIEQARALHGNVDNLSFSANNGVDLADYADAEFDLALSYSVLPHIPPEVVAAYFHEVNRVLKDGAWFRYQFWVGPNRELAQNDTLNIRVYTPEAFDHLNRSAGFKVNEIEEIDYFDPVLELKPIWVNAQKIGSPLEEVNIDFICDQVDSEDEKELEGSLLLYLANKHEERGELDDAETVLEQAIRYDPNRPEGYIAWATLRIERRDDVKGALKIFEILTSQLPDFAPGWVFRAQAEEGLNRKQAALTSLKKAESLSDDEELRSITREIRDRLRGLR